VFDTVIGPGASRRSQLPTYYRLIEICKLAGRKVEKLVCSAVSLAVSGVIRAHGVARKDGGYATKRLLLAEQLFCVSNSGCTVVP